MPDKPSSQVPKTPPPTLEFRGMYKEEEGWLFSLFDTRTQKGNWVRLNEPTGSYTVKEYREEDRTLVLSSGENVFELKMKEPSNISLPIAAVQPVMQAQVYTPPPSAPVPSAPSPVQSPQPAVDPIMPAVGQGGPQNPTPSPNMPVPPRRRTIRPQGQ